MARYISLTKLIPPLLAIVDDEKMAVSTAADYISDLSESQQTDLLTVMSRLDVIPTKGQLAKIKKYGKDGTLNVTVIDAILSEQSPAPCAGDDKEGSLKAVFSRNLFRPANGGSHFYPAGHMAGTKCGPAID